MNKFELSKPTYLKVGPKSENGDIDLVVLFRPNVMSKFQIKSNQKLSNITEKMCYPGIFQLFDNYLDDIKKPDSTLEYQYYLCYEGQSNVRMVKEYNDRKSKDILDWNANLSSSSKKAIETKTIEDNLLNFLDKFKIILIPERSVIKEHLEILYGKKNLEEILGIILYNKQICDEDTFNRIMGKKLDEEKLLSETSEMADHSKDLRRKLKTLKISLTTASERTKKKPYHNEIDKIHTYIDNNLGTFQEVFRENSELYSLLKQLLKITENCHNVGWPTKLKDNEVKWRTRNLAPEEMLTLFHLRDGNRYSEKALNETEIKSRIKKVENILDITTKKIENIVSVINSILPYLEM